MSPVYRGSWGRGGERFREITEHDEGVVDGALCDAAIPTADGTHRHLTTWEAEGFAEDLAAAGWALVYIGRQQDGAA